MADDIPEAWKRRIAELIAELPPMTDEDCRRAAAIFATARPAERDAAA